MKRTLYDFKRQLRGVGAQRYIRRAGRSRARRERVKLMLSCYGGRQSLVLNGMLYVMEECSKR